MTPSRARASPPRQCSPLPYGTVTRHNGGYRDSTRALRERTLNWLQTLLYRTAYAAVTVAFVQRMVRYLHRGATAATRFYNLVVFSAAFRDNAAPAAPPTRYLPALPLFAACSAVRLPRQPVTLVTTRKRTLPGHRYYISSDRCGRLALPRTCAYFTPRVALDTDGLVQRCGWATDMALYVSLCRRAFAGITTPFAAACLVGLHMNSADYLPPSTCRGRMV